MAITGTVFTAGQRLICVGLLCVGLGGGVPTAWAGSPAVATPESLTPGVQVDWGRGVIMAAGSCAAELFAASAEVARVKAERLAHNRAEARLKKALQTLREPRFKVRVAPETLAQLDPAQAKVVHIEYAATGSVALRLELPLTAKTAAANQGAAPPSPPADAAKDGGPAAAAEGEQSP